MYSTKALMPPLNANFSALLVDELDLHAVVQERQLADAPSENFVVVLDGAERRPRCHEMHFGATPLGIADDRQRGYRDTVAELDLMHLAIAPDLELEPFGKRVDDRYADTVQSA
jgi:hypothetical protein